MHIHMHVQGARLSVSAEELQAAHTHAESALSTLHTPTSTAYAVLVDSLEELSFETLAPRSQATAVDGQTTVIDGCRHDHAVDDGSQKDVSSAVDVVNLLKRDRFDIIMSDPFYIDSCAGAGSGGGGTQVDNLRFWKVVASVKEAGLCSDDCVVMPRSARIVGVGVEFEYLRSGQVCICVFFVWCVCRLGFCVCCVCMCAFVKKFEGFS
jgi:hypothetical protein